MAEPALRRMTLDEFLRWEDGSDTRYELIGGDPLAMAPPSPAHGRLAVRLAAALDAALRPRRPCAAQSEVGIARADRDDTCYIADLAVSCDPITTEDQLIRNPILIIEVLWPSTAAFDRQTKVADYRRIDSAEEILLIDSETAFAEILRREGDRWLTEIVQGLNATLMLNSVPLSVAMRELYECIPLPEQRDRGGAGR